jgi:hypothetical protein
VESEHHDQIAVESNHKDQLAVETNSQQGQQIPMPVPVRTVPGNIIFPMPPGFGQGPHPQGNQGHQQQGQGLPLGLRVPPPPGNFFRGKLYS